VSETVVGETPTALSPELAHLRRIAIVPALNEAHSVRRVIDELRAFDPGLDVVVIDDGSADGTADAAAAEGAYVLRLPFNLGIGGAVQTGFKFAFERGYDIAVRVDGDGQHDPAQLACLLGPILRGEADIVVGSRFASERDGYLSSRSRRIGIRILAAVVSRIVGQRVTDTTSGFQALNRHGVALFARDYPHDYPEVEATVMVFRHRLRM
jgi:glycosyltransferase involved in cell wall biosynthesis